MKLRPFNPNDFTGDIRPGERATVELIRCLGCGEHAGCYRVEGSTQRDASDHFRERGWRYRLHGSGLVALCADCDTQRTRGKVLAGFDEDAQR